MRRSLLGAFALLVAVIVWGACDVSQVKAQDYCRHNVQPDLFYNFYVNPVCCDCYGGVPAKLYVSPRPTPPLVGHTYITYQPLMPHEFLYKHHRCYFKCNGVHGGLTYASVCWW